MNRYLIAMLLLFTFQMSTKASVYVGGLEYSLDAENGEAMLVSGTAYGHLEIPESIDYGGKTYIVSSIGNSALKTCLEMTSVSIPNTIRRIGMWAFLGCKKLTSISIPASVTEIGSYPLAICPGLRSISVDKDNPSYDSREDCNAIVETSTNTIIAGCANTIFPSSVKGVASAAFQGCDELESVTIPRTLTSIAPMAFYGCSRLSHIAVEEDNPVYDSRGDCNAIIETATNTLISACRNVVIPETVTRIGNSAFQGCDGLRSLKLPGSVKYIGDYAFYCHSSIFSITMSSSVDSIGSFAFGGCCNLRTLELPSTLSYIGTGAFCLCSNIADIYNYSTVPLLIDSKYTFQNVYTATLHVPAGSLDAYKAAAYWMNFNIVEDVVETTSVADEFSYHNYVDDVIYNIYGQRLKEQRPGINIVGRKKFCQTGW